MIRTRRPHLDDPHAWPDLGGLVLFIAGLLGLGLAFVEGLK